MQIWVNGQIKEHRFHARFQVTGTQTKEWKTNLMHKRDNCIDATCRHTTATETVRSDCLRVLGPGFLLLFLCSPASLLPEETEKTAAQCGMAAALLRTGKHCRGLWKLPNASPVPHSPPVRLSRARDVCGGRSASSRTAHTPATDFSTLGGATGSSVPGPAGSGTASSLRLSPCWTLHHGDSHTHTPPPVTVLPPSTLAWTATHPPPANEHLH